MQDRPFPHLAALADRFTFPTPGDRARFLAALLFAPFPGHLQALGGLPLFFAVGVPGAGKSTLSEAIAQVAVGKGAHRLLLDTSPPPRSGGGGRVTFDLPWIFQGELNPVIAIDAAALSTQAIEAYLKIMRLQLQVLQPGPTIAPAPILPFHPFMIVEMSGPFEAPLVEWGIPIHLGPREKADASPANPLDYARTHGFILRAEVLRAWRIWEAMRMPVVMEPGLPGRWFELGANLGGVVKHVLEEEGALAG